MKPNPIIVIDADAIIAQTNFDDELHRKTQKITSRLIEVNARIIYPTTTIAEAVAHIQRVLKDSVSAFRVAEIARTPIFEIAKVDRNILQTALKYFSPTISKKNTLFDCIVAAVAEEYKADAIFSFDKFYKKKGFKLASELTK